MMFISMLVPVVIVLTVVAVVTKVLTLYVVLAAVAGAVSTYVSLNKNRCNPAVCWLLLKERVSIKVPSLYNRTSRTIVQVEPTSAIRENA